jgi:hypothetical protein
MKRRAQIKSYAIANGHGSSATPRKLANYHTSARGMAQHATENGNIEIVVSRGPVHD